MPMPDPYKTTTHPQPAPTADAPRRRFDALFSDPGDFRGDCRLLQSAIRKRWLDDLPQAERDALADRFARACEQRRADDPEGANVRALLAEAKTVLAMDAADQSATVAELRYTWAGQPTGRTTGRPRTRWHVDDHPGRIDAAALQRLAAAERIDVAALGAVLLKPEHRPDDAGERIAVVPQACGRLLLVCPVCGRRRAKLFATGVGVRCRGCAAIGYADR